MCVYGNPCRELTEFLLKSIVDFLLIPFVVLDLEIERLMKSHLDYSCRK